MKQPHTVLLIVTRRIGDVLLTTPLIRSLRRAWPQAHIDVLVFAGTEGILEQNPDIHQVITIPPRPRFLSHIAFLLRLARQYDLALSTTPGDKPTFYAVVASKRSMGLVYPGNFWKRALLSRSIMFDPTDTHTVLMNLQIAELLNIQPCYQVIPPWNEQAMRSVETLLPFNIHRNSYAVLHPCPMYAYKAWTPSAWIETATWLHQRGFHVVMTGGPHPEEMTYIETLTQILSPRVVNLTGKLTWAQMTYVLKNARVYIGPDTSTTHLAAATGTPTVALFGPSNPVKWGPWPQSYEKKNNPYSRHGTQRVNNVILLQGSGSCVPCMGEGCDRHLTSLSQCLQNLPVEYVKNAVSHLLGWEA